MSETISRTIAILVCALASAFLLSACGGSDAVTVASLSKCAHARPQTLSSPPPTQREVVSKVVHGGWLFQSAGEESEAETQANTPGFEIYVFPSSQAAKEALSMISHAQDPNEEFGGGGTFIAKNVVISTDQDSPGSLLSFANALLKKCAGTTATQSVERSQTSGSESETEASTPETPTTEEPSSEETTSGEVGAPSQAGVSPGQSTIPGDE
jgi:hypothetical protein